MEAAAFFEMKGCNILQKFCALIMAAGSSSRMGGKPKQFTVLEGKSVLLRSLQAFQDCDLVDKIIVVTKKEYFEQIKQQAKSGGITKLICVAQGGSSRMDSVKNGMEYIGDSKYVLVHDCARPLVTNKVICDVAAAAVECGAAICSVPVKDTVKKVDGNGMVCETVDRSSLVSVQTPQGFKAELLADALNKAGDLSLYTDDASVVEAAGHTVKVVSGDYRNIKITTDEDIATVIGFLKEK